MTDLVTGTPLSVLQPGSYSSVDATALTASESRPGGPVVGVLGASLGGKPGALLRTASQSALRTTLRGGAGFELARLALIGGADRVAFVRVGSGIAPSTLNLAGGTGQALTLTSIDYGAWTVGITAAYTSTTGVLTIAYTDPRTGVSFTETFTHDPALNTTLIQQRLVDLVNGQIAGVDASKFVTATKGAGTAPVTVAATALAGGTDNTTLLTADWTAGLKILETAKVDIIVVATSDATVHAQVTAHCLAMSTPASRAERVTVVGGAAGETVTQAVARAAAAGTRNKRVQQVFPGATLFDENGVLKAYPAYLAAGYIAGKHAALADPATSLTHDVLPEVLDVETQLSPIQGGDLDTVLRAGITPIAAAPGGGFWVTDSLTLEPTDPAFRDLIKIRSADAVSQELRTLTEGLFVGKKALNTTAGSIAIAVRQTLERMKNRELIRDYQGEEVAVVQGATPRDFNVVAPVMLIDTVKFLNITVALQPPSTLVGAAATDETF